MVNAKSISLSYTSRPVSALDTAVWWVEYVARTKGAPLLKSHAVDMAWFSYYSLDIYLILTCLIFVICGAVILMFRRLFAQRSGNLVKKQN